MTTFNPRNNKARFYIMLDASNASMFTRAEDPITFTLSAGTKFPTDLSILMKKTGRYISLTSSMIEGVSEPKCIGDNCGCISCVPDGCKNDNCLEKTTSSADVQCNKEACARTNDMKYFVSPLYPAKELYLSEYNPKFRFFKFIPAQTIRQSQFGEITSRYVGEEEVQNRSTNTKQLFETPQGWSLPPGMTIPPGDFIPYIGTIPPDETPPPGWRVLPGMIIPPGGTFPPDFMMRFDEPPPPPQEQQRQMPPGWSLGPGMTIPPEGDFIPYVGTIPPGETFPPGWTVLPGMIIPSREDPNNLQDVQQQLAEEQSSSGAGLSDTIQLPEFVVFSITYPSMYDFNTNDKFLELYQSIMPFNLGFLYFNEDKFLQHNIAVLQQILRVNKLPKTLLDPKKINMTRGNNIGSSVKRGEMVIERFGDVQLKDLSVPTSSQQDTDVVNDTLITPEPDNYVVTIEKKIVSNMIVSTSTAPPKTILKQKKNKGLPTGSKIGIGIGVGVVILFIIFGLYNYWKQQNKNR